MKEKYCDICGNGSCSSLVVEIDGFGSICLNCFLRNFLKQYYLNPKLSIPKDTFLEGLKKILSLEVATAVFTEDTMGEKDYQTFHILKDIGYFERKSARDED